MVLYHYIHTDQNLIIFKMKYRKLINEMKRENKDTLAYYNTFECRHHGRHREVTNLKGEKNSICKWFCWNENLFFVYINVKKVKGNLQKGIKLRKKLSVLLKVECSSWKVRNCVNKIFVSKEACMRKVMKLLQLLHYILMFY